MAARAVHHEGPEAEPGAGVNRGHHPHRPWTNLARPASAGWSSERTLAFEEFLKSCCGQHPEPLIRNVFQVFHDMMRTYVGEGVDEYPEDPESINFIAYDCRQLFVESTDHPFFADRIFANRLVNMIEAFRGGRAAEQDLHLRRPAGLRQVHLPEQPAEKFEEYADQRGRPAATRWSGAWTAAAGRASEPTGSRCWTGWPSCWTTCGEHERAARSRPRSTVPAAPNFVEVPCPSHDNPLLLVPKDQRPAFFDALFENDEFKWNLSTERNTTGCSGTIPAPSAVRCTRRCCTSWATRPRSSRMVHARPYQFNRRLGEGISVFNPGDRTAEQQILTNPMLQRRISALLQDSNQVRYIYSRYAKTNNGIYALMDIKSHNEERLIELHNIISDGVHKVDEIEENVNSPVPGRDEPGGQEEHPRLPVAVRPHRVHQHLVRAGLEHRGGDLQEHLRQAHRGKLPAAGAGQLRARHHLHPPEREVAGAARMDRRPEEVRACTATRTCTCSRWRSTRA